MTRTTAKTTSTYSSKSEEILTALNEKLSDAYSRKTAFQSWVAATLGTNAKYSATNRDILWAHDAHIVATYKQWQAQGVHVTQKGDIKLLAPLIDEGITRINADGTKTFVKKKFLTAAEKKAVEDGRMKLERKFKGFRTFGVFDISKTDADVSKFAEKALKKYENVNLDTLTKSAERYYGGICDTNIQDFLYESIKNDDEFKAKADIRDDAARIASAFILEMYGLSDAYTLSKIESDEKRNSEISKAVHSYAESTTLVMSMM